MSIELVSEPVRRDIGRQDIEVGKAYLCIKHPNTIAVGAIYIPVSNNVSVRVYTGGRVNTSGSINDDAKFIEVNLTVTYKVVK